MVGLTQASRVIAVVSCSDAELGTVTRELVPLNVRALPYLPAAAHVVFATVPVPPPPDASATLIPDPSSNANAATSPGVAEPPVAGKIK